MNPQPVLLIVDNDRALAAALTARLTRRGYQCLAASTGAQGLALFRQHRPDLIVTDLNMPTGSGVALLQNVREISDVPVIVITGFRETYQTELGSFARVTVLHKPFRINELIGRIDAELLVGHRHDATERLR